MVNKILCIICFSCLSSLLISQVNLSVTYLLKNNGTKEAIDSVCLKLYDQKEASLVLNNAIKGEKHYFLNIKEELENSKNISFNLKVNDYIYTFSVSKNIFIENEAYSIKILSYRSKFWRMWKKYYNLSLIDLHTGLQTPFFVNKTKFKLG